MTQARLFKSDETQLVRRTRDVAFPETVTELTIICDGPRRIIAPAGATWDDFFDAQAIMIEETEDPAAPERDGF